MMLITGKGITWSFHEVLTFHIHHAQAVYYHVNMNISRAIMTIRTECSIDQLERMIAEYGKIGSNLNQIARHLNEGGTATKEIVEEVRSAALDLADLKYEILKIVGDAYGNN